jgi:hypothetical protein
MANADLLLSPGFPRARPPTLSWRVLWRVIDAHRTNPSQFRQPQNIPLSQWESLWAKSQCKLYLLYFNKLTKARHAG